jgi:hypothetical protein
MLRPSFLSAFIAVGAIIGVSVTVPAQASLVTYNVTFDFADATPDVIGTLALNDPPLTYGTNYAGVAELTGLVSSFTANFGPSEIFSCSGDACVSGPGPFTALNFDASGVLTAIGAFFSTGTGSATGAASNTLTIGNSDLVGAGLFFELNPLGVRNTVNGIVIAQAVPEPSTWAMIILGFAGLGFMASRKRNGRGSFRWA